MRRCIHGDMSIGEPPQASADAHSTATFTSTGDAAAPRTPVIAAAPHHPKMSSPPSAPVLTAASTLSLVRALQHQATTPPGSSLFTSSGRPHHQGAATAPGPRQRRSAWAASVEDDAAAQQSARAMQQTASSKDTRRLSLEHPRARDNPEYTTRPIGDPVVRELNPVSPSQLIRCES